ncbi:MAG TPA: hypothetical protein PKC43_02620 [Phycisphaerales bacterium]|nr:hypothetical protein [Phycisphaerales bacterium]HMP36320.1 hypothetical protein [Phycisphaerales bacterium]
MSRGGDPDRPEGRAGEDGARRGPGRGGPRRSAGRGGAPISALAIASFALGAVLCCPLTSIAAMILGVVALRRIAAARGALAGRGLAIAAIALAALSLVAQVTLVEYVSRTQVQRLERLARERVEAFVVAVQSGDRAAAESLWSRRAANLDAPALEWLRQELDVRFGELRSVSIVSRSTGGAVLAPRMEVGLVLRFERAERAGSATFAIRPGIGSEDLRLLELRIDDRSGAPLMLPAPQTAVGVAQP